MEPSDLHRDSAEPLAAPKCAGAPTLYIPDFLEAYHRSDRPVAELNEELLCKDWLTDGLVDEIESFFPIQSEINRTDDNKWAQMPSS